MNIKYKVPFLDMKRQYRDIGGETGSAMEKVLASGWYILGEEVTAFEKEFAGYCGARYGIGVASGTEALYISLVASGIGRGDEVITAANAGAPSTTAIELAGAVPVFADVDRDTFNIDPLDVKRKMTRKTKAVIPVHLYGQCADMGPINYMARKKGITVIEDACQAHGSLYKGRKAGSIGRAGCFSFYPTKNLGCYGDGGMIVTSEAGLADKARMIRDYGQKKRYVHVMRGINSRLDEVQAAVLRIKLKHLDAWNRRRAEIAALYGARIVNDRVKKPKEAAYGKHIYHLYVVACDQRDALKEHLKKNGIEALIHYPSVVYAQKAYKGLLKGGRSSAAEELSGKVLSLPLYPEMASAEAKLVCEAVNGWRP
jgi:dTDP-4-amino-4,6-dideoxygalactose transaminase